MTDSRPTPRLHGMPGLAALAIIALAAASFAGMARAQSAPAAGEAPAHVVGEPAAYGMAVRNAESKLRCTHLREKILAVT